MKVILFFLLTVASTVLGRYHHHRHRRDELSPITIQGHIFCNGGAQAYVSVVLLLRKKQREDQNIFLSNTRTNSSGFFQIISDPYDTTRQGFLRVKYVCDVGHYVKNCAIPYYETEIDVDVKKSYQELEIETSDFKQSTIKNCLS